MKIDLRDVSIFEKNKQLEIYEWLRCNARVFKQVNADETYFYIVSDYESVRDCLSDSSTYINGKGTSISSREEDVERSILSVHNSDGNGHSSLRRAGIRTIKAALGRPGFLERVDVVLDEYFNRIDSDEALDISQKFSIPVSIALSLTLLSLDSVDMKLNKHIESWLFSPDVDVQLNSKKEVFQALRNLVAFATQRSDSPDDFYGDLIGFLKAEAIVDLDIASAYLMTLISGQVKALPITLNFLFSVYSRDILCNVQNGYSPEWVTKVVDEIVRLSSPASHMARTVGISTTLGEYNLKKGDKVILCLASANRDSSFFENPDQLSIDKRQCSHLSFGLGIHHCIGSTYAELVISKILAKITERFTDIEVLEPPTYFRSNWFSGIEGLVVRLVRSRVE